jgi:hypothetical protein
MVFWKFLGCHINAPFWEQYHSAVTDIYQIYQKSRGLATILSFVIQNLTEYIHCTSCTFRNHSEPLNDSRNLQLYRVGSGVTPAASHTTGHTVPYHGGSLL